MNRTKSEDHAADWAGARYWKQAAREELRSLDALLARCDVAVVGIDGGGLDDLLGLVVMGRERGTGHLLVWAHAWAHKDVLDRRKDIVSELRGFEKDRDLTICKTPTQDVEEVADIVVKVRDSGLMPEVAGVGVDAVGIVAVKMALAWRGVRGDQIVDVAQGCKLSGVVESIPRQLRDGTFLHGGTALLAWSVGNVKIEVRGSAMLMTKQVAGRAKIDVVAAMMNAAMLMSRYPEAAGDQEGGHSESATETSAPDHSSHVRELVFDPTEVARVAEAIYEIVSDEPLGDLRGRRLAVQCEFEDGARAAIAVLEELRTPRPRRDLDVERDAARTFQQRVQPWLMECFGEVIAGDREERNHRFLEEALELVQACGCTASEAHQLVDYVYGRAQGEPEQETGGVMVTLAALCLANGLDMHGAAENELARIWTKVDAIRAKQAAKPQHSPLPQHPATSWEGTAGALVAQIARMSLSVEQEEPDDDAFAALDHLIRAARQIEPDGANAALRAGEVCIVNSEIAADAMRALLSEIEAAAIKRLADVAQAIGWQARVGGRETAGAIVSYLATSPAEIEPFFAGRLNPIDFAGDWMRGGCLTWHGADGKVWSPAEAAAARAAKAAAAGKGEQA